MKRLPSIVFPALCAAIFGASALESTAALFYLQLNQSGTIWTQLSDWNDLAGGGGSAPGSINGNSFDNQGLVLRSGSTTGTFGNASTVLTLSAGSGNGLVIRSTGNSSIANLITTGGKITAGTAGASILATNFDNVTGAILKPEDQGSVRTINLTIGTLTGGGNFSITNGGTINLSATTATAYTGNFTFIGSVASTLNFASDFTTAGGLVLTDALSRITLNQNVTVANLNINSVSLAADNYTWAELNAVAPTIFNAAGTGSITVVPEPGALGMLGLLGLGCAVRRRPR